MLQSWWGGRHCFSETVLEEVTFQLGFETHRGGRVGGPSQSAGVGWTWKVRLLSEDFRSPAVWAALCGGFPGAERHDEKSTRTGECSKRGWETRPALRNPRAASLSIH